jgi:hypothetical protein
VTLLTDHPYAQGFTDGTHFAVAAGIAFRLLRSAYCVRPLRSAVAFAIHAILPFVSIEPRLDLEATSAYLLARNRFVEQSALTNAIGKNTQEYWGRTEVRNTGVGIPGSNRG